MKDNGLFSKLTNVFLVIALATSIVVFSCALIAQSRSQSFFSQRLDSIVAILRNDDNPTESIDDLARLVELHQAASSADTTAFFYTFFSSVFIALGAAFVKHVHDKSKNVDDITSRLSETILAVEDLKKRVSVDEIETTVSAVEDFKKRVGVNKITTTIDAVENLNTQIDNASNNFNELLAMQNIMLAKEWLAGCLNAMQAKEDASEDINKYLPRVNDNLRYFKKYIHEIKARDIVPLVFIAQELTRQFDICRETASRSDYYSKLFSDEYVKLSKTIIEECISALGSNKR